MLRSLLVALLLSLATLPAGGQQPALVPGMPPLVPPPPSAPAPGAEPGAELAVYVLTMGAGDAVWEKFGHNALWIRDPGQGTDLAYNWGLFDFDQAGFIPRFLQGRMLYSMGGIPGIPTIDFYARQLDRSLWLQELDLTPAQKRELRDFVQWNDQDENRHYRYDYYGDNCSTRVRDAIDRVLGGQLRAATDTLVTDATFRWHTRRLTQGEVPVYTGINIMLGQPTDRRITAWEEMFLPVQMHRWLATVQVAGDDGSRRPLVRQSMQLYQATRPAELAAPTDLRPLFLAIGVALAALLWWLAFRARVAVRTGTRGGRTAFVAIGTLWSLLAGLAGTLMLLTWLATDHVYAYRNENVLQLMPLSLLLALLLPRLRRHPPSLLTRNVAAAIALLSALGFLLQLLPGFNQANGEVIALVLPVHLALAWGVWSMFDAAVTRVEPST